MPLLNPDVDPSWAEIQAGFEANDIEQQAVLSAINQEELKITNAKAAIRQLNATQRQVSNNYRKWERAIKTVLADR